MTHKKLLAIALLTAAISLNNSYSSIAFNIGAARINDQNGNTIAAGSLFQLINLGADGFFNQINIADGSSTGLNRWVSGDDSVLDVALINGDSATFSSTKAFDLLDGPDGSDGLMNRAFEFDILTVPATNMKFGLRWWPSITAANFNSINSANGLANGTRYGEFTRTTSQYGDLIWTTPGSYTDGLVYQFDNLLTDNFAPPGESNALGNASQIVVPEPASSALVILGIASVCSSRRRRK